MGKVDNCWPLYQNFRCEVRGEEVLTPVCVTVTDQEVDEYCKDVAPDVNCYDRRCSQSPKVKDWIS